MSDPRPRSSSVGSNKDLPLDNIVIHVNICDGKDIKLNIRPIHSVSNILEFLSVSASTNLPPNARLVMGETPLQPSSTAAELKLSETSTLHIDPPVRRSASPITAQPPTSELKSSEITTLPNPTSLTPTPPSSTGTSRTSTPSNIRKSNKPRCTKTGCKAPAQPIVGDCGFCQKRFCGKHRMLESHNCEGLADARQADKDRNAAKLEGERTVMLRGL